MRLLPTLLLFVVLMVPTSGWSQATSVRSQASAEDRKAAITLFGQSREAYQAGRFKQAAELLKRAYGLDPAPTLLYNLARALESDGDLDGALDAYRRYLRADPQAKDRAAIEQRINNLDAQIKERAALEQKLQLQQAQAAKAKERAALAKVQRPAPEPESSSPVPWIIAGTGAAGLVAGGVLGGLAQSKYSSAEQASSQSEAATLDADARNMARGANIAFIAGGTLAATGLVWGLIQALSGDDEAQDAVGLSPVLGPRHIGIAARF